MFLLYHGADEFSAHEELARLRAGGGFDFNQDTFAGAETDFASIRNTCETLPFLSERRLVVVHGLPKRRRGTDGDDAEDDDRPAAKSTRAKKGKAAASEGPRAWVQALAAYAERVPETTTLAVLADEPLEEGHPLLQAARRHGEVREFAPPRGARLEAWLTQRARTRDARLAPDAARLLVEAAGEDLRLLASEIEKLSTYAGEGGEIEVAEVRALTPTAHELRAFDLTDALVRRDRRRALTLLHELLDAGQAPLAILGMVAFQTRALLQVKSLAERGMRAAQIAQTAGMAPFVVDKSLGLARGFSFEELESAHRSLLEIDTALKRSRATPEMALDLLVLEFGGGGKGP